MERRPNTARSDDRHLTYDRDTTGAAADREVVPEPMTALRLRRTALDLEPRLQPNIRNRRSGRRRHIAGNSDLPRLGGSAATFFSTACDGNRIVPR